MQGRSGPLADKQGNRPTGHDQEGRRGLNEVVPGTSVFPLSETGVLGDFWGRIKGAHSSILAWRIPWTEESGGLQSMGSQRVGHDSATNTRAHTHVLIRAWR